MALLITKNETILGDIDISQIYLRLTISFGPEGEILIVQGDSFSSKESYNLDPYNNKFYMQGIDSPYTIDYNRETDGGDILIYVHNQIKSILSTDLMKEEPVLDPSTGEATYDSSTGLAIMEEVIDIPKFAQDSSILIVDVSIG